MMLEVNIKVEEGLTVNEIEAEASCPDESDWNQSGDMFLMCSDVFGFSVHREVLKANSRVFTGLLHDLPPHNSSDMLGRPRRGLNFKKKEVFLVLSFLYAEMAPKIVSLKAEGIWGAINFAVSYQVDTALEGFAKACRRYSTETSTLEQKLLAFFVAACLGSHALLNSCYKLLLHHHPHPKVLNAALSRMLIHELLPRVKAIQNLVHFLVYNHTTYFTSRQVYQNSLSHHLKQSQIYNHSLPYNLNCTCTRGPSIVEWWSMACQAKQHDLKTIVGKYEGHSCCDEVARKAMKSLWEQGERIGAVYWSFSEQK